jgi:muramoyltetrapeptide carboxypeptidase
MYDEGITVHSKEAQATSVLTTHGAAERVLTGGNPDMASTSAGWNLPKLPGAIL